MDQANPIPLYLGMFKGSAETDVMVLSDGKRELYESEFSHHLESSSSPDRGACSDCNCVFLGPDYMLHAAKCTESRPFMCEFKGGPPCPKGMASLFGDCYGLVKNYNTEGVSHANCYFESGNYYSYRLSLFHHDSAIYFDVMKAYLDLNEMSPFVIFTEASVAPTGITVNAAGSGTYYAYTHETGSWEVKTYTTAEGSYSLCNFYGN